MDCRSTPTRDGEFAGLRLLLLAPAYVINCAEAIVLRNLVDTFRRHGMVVDIVWRGTDSMPEVELSGSSEDSADLPRTASPTLLDTLWRSVGNLIDTHARRLLRLYGDWLWPRAALDLSRELVRRNRYDFLMSSVIGHWVAARIHEEAGIPWLVSWNDPFPHPKSPPPYGRGPRARLWIGSRMLLDRIGRYGSWYVFPSERLRRYVLGYMPSRMAGRSSVVPHVAHTPGADDIQPPASPFTLCHAGPFIRARNPRLLIEAIEDAQSRTTQEQPFRLLAVGDKKGVARLTAAEMGARRTIIETHPKLPYEQSLNLIRQSHVLVVLEAPLEEGIFLPSKFVDYVQVGRPVLAVSPKQGVLADLLCRHGGGLAVDCTDAASIRTGILTLYEAWKNGTLDAKFSSRGLRHLFSESTVVAEYRTILDNLMNRPDTPAAEGHTTKDTDNTEKRPLTQRSS